MGTIRLLQTVTDEKIEVDDLERRDIARMVAEKKVRAMQRHPLVQPVSGVGRLAHAFGRGR